MKINLMGEGEYRKWEESSIIRGKERTLKTIWEEARL